MSKSLQNPLNPLSGESKAAKFHENQFMICFKILGYRFSLLLGFDKQTFQPYNFKIWDSNPSDLLSLLSP